MPRARHGSVFTAIAESAASTPDQARGWLCRVPSSATSWPVALSPS